MAKDRLEYFRKYREVNREKLRKYNREYNRMWRLQNGYHNETKWRNDHPIKVASYKILHLALQQGMLKKQPCKFCKNKNAVAHHPDYSKPLKVVWVCRIHHRQIHYGLTKRQKPPSV
jgi:hypothetical protein